MGVSDGTTIVRVVDLQAANGSIRFDRAFAFAIDPQQMKVGWSDGENGFGYRHMATTPLVWRSWRQGFLR